MKCILYAVIISLALLGACTAGELPDTEQQVEQETLGETMNPIVNMQTNKGTIRIELFMDAMPETAGNFKKLVEQGFYDGIIFHRVIDGFMVQGGDPSGTGTGGPGYMIPDEKNPNNRNDRGTLSMANAGPNTGGSQFFINLADNNFLDGGRPGVYHPVFGKVAEGMDVVDAIAKVRVDGSDGPVEDIVMEKVTIE